MKRIAIKAAQVLLWLVYLWVAVTLVLLVLEFVLQLFGANPTAGFVQWVYRSTERAMAPFRGIFEPVPLSDQSVLDISVLFAMIVYAFVALGLHALIDWVTRQLRTEERAERERQVTAAQAVADAPAQVLQLNDPSGAAAVVTLRPEPYGTSVKINASGLDPMRSYSAWLQGRDGARVSTATFQPNATGTASLSLTSPASLAQSEQFGLSMLPRLGESTSTDLLSSPLV